MAEITESKNFIHAFIEEDIAEGGRYAGMTVHTRFPPEPNGYLHIGHCKALIIDFGTAEKFGGICNLRMDDTNPTKEDVEFVDAIKEDIRWLGFDWGTFDPNKTGLLLTNSLWYGQLMNSAEFRTAIKARWAEIKPIFENIDTFIEEQADLIRESEAVNHEMWPIDSRHNYPNGDELMDFDSAVERMKQAIDDRIIALDSAINAL